MRIAIEKIELWSVFAYFWPILDEPRTRKANYIATYVTLLWTRHKFRVGFGLKPSQILQQEQCQKLKPFKNLTWSQPHELRFYVRLYIDVRYVSPFDFINCNMLSKPDFSISF